MSGRLIVERRRGLRLRREVALTFDDGPSEWTPDLLDVLGAHGARGTFYVLGASIPGREAVVRRTAAEGHELGNHCATHLDPAGLSDEELRVELDATSEAIREITGAAPRTFRPPYAGRDERVARVAAEAGLRPTVLRSVDPADWRTDDPSEIAERVIAGLRPGAIVCLHDGIPPANRGTGSRVATVTALEPILRALQARRLAAVTVSELLA